MKGTEAKEVKNRSKEKVEGTAHLTQKFAITRKITDTSISSDSFFLEDVYDFVYDENAHQCDFFPNADYDFAS